MQIRPATAADLDELIAIEVEAGALFHSVGMHEVAADVPERAPLARQQADGRLWVADGGTSPVGFIAASIVDGNAHIDQVSVRPSHGRRGVGRALLRHVEEWGRAQRLPGTTLTTFRDVPWNGPYYARLGYRELAGPELGPELVATMAHEATWPGIDADLRCAMLKVNAGGR